MTDSSLWNTFQKTVLIPPHPAGIPFILGAFVLALLFFAFSAFLGSIAFLLGLFCLYFFRDPDRITPTKDSLILAGGDGKISAIVYEATLPPEFSDLEDGPYTRVSTFLSVLNVHVNRIPVEGKIIKKIYSPGKFLNADLDKASEDNERCSFIIETKSGVRIGVVQIAGLIARRILNDLKEGDEVKSGARFGIIRFGSRVDIYMPQKISPLVCVGQTAVGAETVLADMGMSEPAREGRIVS